MSVRVLLLSLLWPALSAAAQSNPYEPPQRALPKVIRSSSTLWAELGRPGVRRAAELTDGALAHASMGARLFRGTWTAVCQRTHSMPLSGQNEAAQRGRRRALETLMQRALQRRAFMDNALARLQRALQLVPNDPRALHAMFEVLSRWEEPGPLWGCSAQQRSDEALAVLVRLRARHPQYRASEVAFELGLLHTHAQRFAEASAAYSDAIALSLEARESPTTRANLAEVTMLAGRLEEALAHYSHALTLRSDGRQHLLTRLGMAVALDRLGEHERALETITAALGDDPLRMRILRSDEVFFVPQYEVFYYEGLAHEAVAADDPKSRKPALEAARDAFQAYVRGASTSDRFLAAARANLQRMNEALAVTRQDK